MALFINILQTSVIVRKNNLTNNILKFEEKYLLMKHNKNEKND